MSGAPRSSFPIAPWNHVQHEGRLRCVLQEVTDRKAVLPQWEQAPDLFLGESLLQLFKLLKSLELQE
jgi:hypothetical protein